MSDQLNTSEFTLEPAGSGAGNESQVGTQELTGDRQSEEFAPTRGEDGIPIGPPPEEFNPQTSGFLRDVRELASLSPDPEREASRIQGALTLSRFTGVSPELAYNNLDSLSEEFFGSMFQPDNSFEAFRLAHRNASKDIDIGRLMSRALVSSDPRSFLQQAHDIDATKTHEQLENYSIGQKIANAVGSMTPYITEPAPQIIGGLAAGAGIAALAVTGVGATASIAAAASQGARIGRAVTSFAEMSRIMSGLQFYQMLQAEDEDGNQLPISMARNLSIGSGVLNGLIEATQLDMLSGNSLVKNIWKKSVASTLAESGQRGVGTAIARGWMADMAGNVSIGTAQEVAQESVDFYTYNAAVRAANQMEQSNIPVQDQREFFQMLPQLIGQSATGLSVLSIPGSFRSAFRNSRVSRTASQAVEDVRRATGGEMTPELQRAIESQDGDRIDQEIGNIIERTEVKPQDVELQSTDDGFSASVRGQQLANFSLERDGNTVRFTEAAVEQVIASDPEQQGFVRAATEKMINNIYEQNPDAVFEFNTEDANQRVIKRVIEDGIDDTRQLNKMLDQREAAIQSLESDRNTIQAEIGQLVEQVAQEEDADTQARLDQIREESTNIEAEIYNLRAEYDRLSEVKEFHDNRNFDRKKPYTKTTEEFARRVRESEQYNQNFWHTKPTGEYVISQLREMYDGEIISDSEASMVVELFRHAADNQQKTFDQFIKDEFAPGIFQSGDVVDQDLKTKKARASIKQLSDGRSIISVAQDGDFASLMHEIGHKYVNYLTEADQRIVADWLGERDYRPSTWKAASHEQFVNGYFKWAHDKEQFSGPLARVFAHFKQFLDRAVELLNLNRELTPEMRGVYDRLFGENQQDTESADFKEAMAQAKQNVHEAFDQAQQMGDEAMELFQPSLEHERYVREAVKNYEPVPINVLEEYADREWAQQEIKRQEAEIERRQELAWLYDIAKESTNYEAFLEEAQLNLPIDLEVDDQFFEDIYHDATVTDVRDGNQKWFNSLTDADIQMIADVANKGFISDNHPVLAALAKKPTPAQLKAARTFITNNATTIRRDLYTTAHRYLEDAPGVNDTEMRKLRRELEKTTEDVEEKMKPIAKMTTDEIRERLQVKRNESAWVKLRRKNASIKEFDKLIDRAGKELGEATSEIETSGKNMRRLMQELLTTSEFDTNQNRELQELITKINREIEKPSSPQTIRTAVQKVAKSLRGGEEIAKEYRKYRAAQERMRANRQRTQEARKIKKHMETLANRVIRAGRSQSVSAPIRSQIQSYAAILEPSFRSKKKLADIKELRRRAKNDPSILSGVSERDKVLVSKRSLNEFSIEELEGIYNEVMNLRQLGVADMQRIRAANEARWANIAQSLTDVLPFEISDEELPAAEGERRSRRLSGRNLMWDTWRPNRLADKLDGKAGFRGDHHEFFINEVNRAENQKVSQLRQRHQWLVQRLNDIGYQVDEANLQRKLGEMLQRDFGVANGTSYSLDAVLDMYAGFKNPRKKAGIIMGNARRRIMALMERGDNAEVAVNKVETEFQSLIDKLSDQQKQLADIIIDEYAENFERVEQATALYENKILGQEEFYTPMEVRGENYDTHEKQLEKELAMRAGIRRAGIDRGFQNSRLQNIKLEHRKPLNLGLYSAWERNVGRQEHYMAYAEWAQSSSKLFKADVGRSWRNRIEQAAPSGDQLIKQMSDYRDRVVSGSTMRADSSVEKLISHFRTSSAIAYLAGNMVTVLKQAPSMAFYLVEANPLDLMNAIGQASSDWNGFRKRVTDRNPQIWNRNRDRDFQAIENLVLDPKTGRTTKKIADAGTALIRVVDSFVVSVGEEAVYQKALRDGKSEQEAAELAMNVTLRTQPAGGAKDSSKVFTQPMLYLFTQFSNQLNQIWNMFTYDLPSGYSKREFARQRIGTAVALAASSYFIWMLSNRKFAPEEDKPEDLVNLIAGQFLSSIPVAGPLITAQMAGYEPSLAATAPLRAIGEIAGIGLSALDGNLSEYDRYNLLNSLTEGAAISIGLPYIVLKRVYDAFNGAVNDDLSFFETLQTGVTGGVWGPEE